MPIIGVGGIASGEDAYEKIKAGASVVEVYSSLVYKGMGLVPSIKKELVELLHKDGYASIEEAVGKETNVQLHVCSTNRVHKRTIVKLELRPINHPTPPELLFLSTPTDLLCGFDSNKTRPVHGPFLPMESHGMISMPILKLNLNNTRVIYSINFPKDTFGYTTLNAHVSFSTVR